MTEPTTKLMYETLSSLQGRSDELRRQCATETARRDEPAPSWLPAVAPALVERFAAEERAAAEHAAACTDRPCERCARYICACGTFVDGAGTCPVCLAGDLLEATLAPTRSSIPARFRWAVDAAPDMLASRVQGSRALVDRGLTAPPTTNLLFTGQTGAGKTSLAVAMLDAWVRVDPNKRRGALFVEASWLSRARARHKLGQGEAELVERCIAAPLLLLDDLGQEREDRDGCITDVVYGRSRNDLPTWVTCGLADGTAESLADHLARRYDGGFVRRVLENGKRVELGR